MTANAAVKGGIQRLINCVVDVVAEDRDSTSSGDGEADKKEPANGVGIIIDENGYIVTNYHVISATDKIKIVLYNGREYAARIIGKDERSDIVLLKIDVDTKLPYVQFADSDKTEIGEPVIAIGNPFGFGKTVSAGIISYKGRNLSSRIAELGEGGDLVSYIQTDVSVNYGNSGGPLFTHKAELVGMITIFFFDGMHYTGINFAIPSNTMKKVINELKVHGKMQRSWIGISVSAISKKARHALKLDKPYGYAIVLVEENSPAAAAGIQRGDILMSLNNEAILENTDLELLLSNLPIGEVIPIQVRRGEIERKLSVMVSTRSDGGLDIGEDMSSKGENIPREEIKSLGIRVADLTSDLRRRFSIPDNIKGVVVSDTSGVAESSLAEDNVIVSVNQTNVSSVVNLKKELQKLGRSSDSKKNGELAFFVFNPHTREFQYISLDFNPANEQDSGGKLPAIKEDRQNLIDRIKYNIRMK
jgi:serine protease Do